MIKRSLSKDDMNKNPYLEWNEFVDILAMTEESELSEIQLIGYDAFWYDSEIQNGGHLQYFENMRKNDYSRVIEALKKIGAIEQAKILGRASSQFATKKRSIIKDIFTFVKKALDGEYDDFDSLYYKAEPTVIELLGEYLKKNKDAFFLYEN